MIEGKITKPATISLYINYIRGNILLLYKKKTDIYIEKDRERVLFFSISPSRNNIDYGNLKYTVIWNQQINYQPLSICNAVATRPMIM